MNRSSQLTLAAMTFEQFKAWHSIDANADSLPCFINSRQLAQSPNPVAEIWQCVQSWADRYPYPETPELTGQAEHDEHVAGEASEFDNCLREAGDVVRENNYLTDRSTGALVAAGAFVVVGASTYYCRSTDAVVGEWRTLDSHWETRAEADAKVRRLFEILGDDYDGEVGWSVLPALPPVSAVTGPGHGTVADEDECPF
jgi:hypothetical protein